MEAIEYVKRYPQYKSTPAALLSLNSTLKQGLNFVTNIILSALSVPEVIK